MSNMTLIEPEWKLVKEYVLLPLLLDTVRKNQESIAETKFSLTRLYVKSTHRLGELIQEDINNVRRQIRELKASIVEVKRNDQGIMYEVRLRGYVSEYALLKHTVRNDMSTRLNQYIEAIFKQKAPSES